MTRCCTLFLLAMLAACGEVVVVSAGDAGAPDAGAPRDAGPDAGVDAGGAPEDAGFLVDAGDPPPPYDAGPQCEFDDNPVIPFACEGDEDFCSPIPDRPEPAGDLLAGWSRIDGDDVVIDLRFLAAPYRRIDFEGVSVLFEHNVLPPYQGISDHSDPLISQSLWGGEWLQLANDDYTEREGYPPPVRDGLPVAFDFCNVSLGVESPMMRLQVPLALAANADGTVRYAVQVGAPDRDQYSDTSWFGGPKHFEIPQGGAPDEADDLLGICSMDCSDGQLP